MDEQRVYIDRISADGRGRAQGAPVEVIGSVPGDQLLVQLRARKKRMRVGVIQEITAPSADRVPLRCMHAPVCGGCTLQQMDYAAQLKLKQKIIEDFFPFGVLPIIPCEDPWRYRNKMEFSFSENREGEKFLGLIIGGSRGHVMNLSECHLVDSWFTELLARMRGWWKESNLSAYRPHVNEGHLRTLTLREAKQGSGKMVILTVSGAPEFALTRLQINSFVAAVKELEADASIFLRIHQAIKGQPTQFFEMHLAGADHITEKLVVGKDVLEFKISPSTFFQPNTLQAQKLYTKALGMATQLDGGIVFDLYCGGATLGLSAAKRAKEVIGIELNPNAVCDAERNQEVNCIENFSIFKGDVGLILEQKEFKQPDLVIIDPPRSGLDDRALNQLIRLNPKEILYISCNPKTQAANIEKLNEKGYQLKAIQPVDQFPHTIHIENICLLGA